MLDVFNVLPDAGGVLDQDKLLLDDILLYKAIKDSLRDKANDDDNPQPKGEGHFNFGEAGSVKGFSFE